MRFNAVFSKCIHPRLTTYQSIAMEQQGEINFGNCLPGTRIGKTIEFDPGWTEGGDVLLYLSVEHTPFSLRTCTISYTKQHNLQFDLVLKAPNPEPPSGFCSDLTDDISTQYSNALVLANINSGEFLQIPCVCEVLLPRFRVPVNNISFGACSLNDSRVEQLVLYNDSSLEVDWCITRVANILFEPESGIVKPRSSAFIRVIFRPTRLGTFSAETIIRYSNRSYKIRIKLDGLCYYNDPGLVPEMNLDPPDICLEEILTDFQPASKPRKIDWDNVSDVRTEFASVSEKRECHTVLDMDEQRNIILWPINGFVDLGSVYPGEAYTKQVKLYNQLEKSILVEARLVVPFSDGITFGDHRFQVVLSPRGRLGAFTFIIKPSATVAHPLLTALYVNGHLFGKVSFHYNLVPKRLDLNLTELKLDFSPTNLGVSTRERVTVHNPCSCSVALDWTVDVACISIVPNISSIPPLESIDCEVIYTPEPGAHYIETDARLSHCSVPLRLTATCPITACQLEPKKIDLGAICLGDSVQVASRIVNGKISTIPAVFNLSSSSPQVVSVTPSQGIVAQGSTGTEVCVVVQTTTLGAFEENIVLNVRSGRPLNLVVTGETIRPLLSLQPDSLFAECVVGSVVSCSFAIRNEANADTSVTVPDLAAGWHCSSHTIKLGKGSTTQVPVTFSPDHVGQIRQTINLKSAAGDVALVLNLESNALAPPVSIGPTRILNFGTVVMGSNPLVYGVQLKLEDTAKSKTWQIIPPREMISLLEFAPCKGLLTYESPIADVQVSLNPTIAQRLNDLVEVIIGDSETRLSVNVIGDVKIPSIKIESDEIHFGTCVIGNFSDAKQILIVNDGFENDTKVEIRLTPTQSKFLSISFPDGPIVNRHQQRLLVEVRIRSTHPVCIHTQLELTVGGNKQAGKIRVHGAIDNSVLTQLIADRNPELEELAAYSFLEIESVDASRFDAHITNYIKRIANQRFNKLKSRDAPKKNGPPKEVIG